MAESHIWHERKIAGTIVKLPVQPYPCQMSMMHRVLESVSKSKHCLIESPTGTGKTLALLSSVLAWQRDEKERLEKEGADEASKIEQMTENLFYDSTTVYVEDYASELDSDVFDSPIQMTSSTGPTCSTPMSITGHTPSLCVPDDVLSEEDDSEFVESVWAKHCTIKCSSGTCESPKVQKNRCDVNICENKLQPRGPETSCCSDINGTKREEGNLKMPRIYYGTRTHKQVAQIVSELKRTPYTKIRHTILSSREHTCVHPDISKLSNKSQLCKELRAPEGLGCTYYHTVKKNYDKPKPLRQALMDLKIWDIEELVAKCKQDKICPYFAATRVMKEDAELIICPYNYLIDPMIRESMGINLDGDVVILDEAHNIEDACREAASFTITVNELKDAYDNFLYLSSPDLAKAHSSEPFSDLQTCFKYFLNMCDRLQTWLDNMKRQGEESASCEGSGEIVRVWDGRETKAIFDQLDLLSGDTTKVAMGKLGKAARSDEKEMDRLERLKQWEFPRAQATSVQTVEKIIYFLQYFFAEQSRQDDYKMVLENKTVYHIPDDGRDENESFSIKRRRISKLSPKIITSLHFWCLNPAVSFCDSLKFARSVILASGTLCPTETFKSELGLNFSLSLEANHVLPRDRVFPCTVKVGPSNTALRCTYDRYNNYIFQDELGRLVRDVCRVVPGGVLVFLPSYFLLGELKKRWRDTKIDEEIKKCKQVILEPKSGEELKHKMKEFYSAARNPKLFSDSITGAVFLGVCRGKVSEGLDFADQDARAVITVGIPFPSIKDKQVDLKKKYNDNFCKVRQLLPGKVWYEKQAFRALNQALGRCLRHKNDWGALIMVDERFSQNPDHYCAGISKWIRRNLRHYSIFAEFLADLSEFSAKFEYENSF